MAKKFVIIFILLSIGFVVICSLGSSSSEDFSKDLYKDPVAGMEHTMEEIRKELKIPGMSVAIANEDGILWSKSFGWADKELQIPTTENSLFHLASLTKPYSSIILLQLVQEGRLDLNAPVSEFGIKIENNKGIQVKHLLSHTSSGEPGTVFKYDGNRFAQLEIVIEKVSGNTFAQELRTRIIEPWSLHQTVPNPLDSIAFNEAGGDMTLVKKYFVTEYARKWGRIFWPSGLFGPMETIDYPEYFGTAAGLVATASDVARFSMVLDRGLLLEPSFKTLSYTPVQSPSGEIFPFGLGWYLETYNDHLIAWQYGHWFGSSSLIIKIPKEKVTFVILANSDGLSRRTKIGDKATINASPVAYVFLEKLFRKELNFK